MPATAEAGPAVAGAHALRIGRGLVLGAIAALWGLFLIGLVQWGLHGQELLPLWVAADGWTAAEVRAVLAGWAVPVGWLTGYYLLLEILLAAAGGIGAYFVLRSARSWFRLYLALVLVLFGTMSGGVPVVLAALHPGHAWLFGSLQGLAWVSLFLLAYLFPDGRFVPAWGRWPALAWLGLLPGLYLLEWLDPPAAPALEGGALVMLFGTAAIAPIYRYLRASDPVGRLQIRWVVVALALRFAISAATIATPLGALQNEVSPRGLLTYAVVMLLSYAIAALLPAAIAIAIVRHRLFDLDIWINLGLVYALLTGFVIGVYGLVVGGIGWLWPGGERTALPLLATALVAVAFSPVRERVQRGVSRLVYGQRGEPYAVVSQLGQRLGSAVPPDVVLRTIVDTVGPALRLRYVQATLAGNRDTTVTYPSPPPAPPPATATFPLRYHREELGVLAVATRPGEELTDSDRALLSEVSRQAGIAVQAARLTADLRQSRERAVVAREEERRRLHRDLHDGLGPTLASLYQRIDAARSQLERNRPAADALLAGAATQIRDVIGEIRRLVYSLRPPALDELGLAAALEEACQQLALHPDRVTIDVTAGALPPLPAVVEVAAYRIALEAVTNVVRHAHARNASVHLNVSIMDSEASLVVEVVDDGVGISAATPAGAGLRSMRERAEEIGGSLTAVAAHPRGTRVRACLPLSVGDYDQEA